MCLTISLEALLNLTLAFQRIDSGAAALALNLAIGQKGIHSNLKQKIESDLPPESGNRAAPLNLAWWFESGGRHGIGQSGDHLNLAKCLQIALCM